MTKAPGKRQKSPPHFFVRKDPSSHTELITETGEDEMALSAKKQIKAIRIKGLSSWLLPTLETSTRNPRA